MTDGGWSTFIEVHKLLKSGRSGEQVIPGGMWVPVAVWQPCELLYTCCFLTYLVAREEINVELTFLRWTFPSCYYLLSIRLVLSICFTVVDERFSKFLCFFRVSKMFLVGLAQWLKWYCVAGGGVSLWGRDAQKYLHFKLTAYFTLAFKSRFMMRTAQETASRKRK